MRTGTWLGRLFRPQIKVQTIDEIIRDLSRINNKIKLEEQCIWYRIMKKDTEISCPENPYHCKDCDGYKKECHGYVPINFYRK